MGQVAQLYRALRTLYPPTVVDGMELWQVAVVLEMDVGPAYDRAATPGVRVIDTPPPDGTAPVGPRLRTIG